MAVEAPTQLVTTWDEGGVADLFASLGFPWYSDQIKEHGITGEILVHLDHEALKDVGIHSVGQRLAILRAVYALKVEQNVPVEEGHYVPPSDELEDEEQGPLPSRQVLSLLYERDDRIRNLELQVQQLHHSLVSLKEDIRPLSALSAPANTSTIKINRAPVRSPTTPAFAHPLSSNSNLSRNTSVSRPRPLNTSVSNVPDSPRSPMDSAHILVDDSHPSSEVPSGPSSSITPAASNSAGEYGGIPLFTSAGLTPTTPTGPVTNDPAAANTGTLSSSLAVGTSASAVASGGKDKHSASSGEASNPYRSFRVTLEDPCYKVLPAALKKYKINDDWKLYALFICYGNTERCLAYDEKPLLLFQRLKESNANPVFMLRHMKDIKSPINIASQKHALKRDKRDAKAGNGLDKPPVVDRNGVGMARSTRLHHPPVLLPVGKDKDRENGRDDGDAGAPPPSPREVAGYCISIYPYLADREDEFDVAVGDTFVIISKTKGWWVVHRDLGPNGASDTATRKSAWVPAGCLLETSVPPLSLPGAAQNPGTSPYNASHVPIEPGYVLSVSTPGIALMDYAKVGSDELDVKKGQSLRILKRYNHWSYAIKEDGQRGWIPSWFCGRASREGEPKTPTLTSHDSTRRPSVGRNAPTSGAVPSSAHRTPSAPSGSTLELPGTGDD